MPAFSQNLGLGHIKGKGCSTGRVCLFWNSKIKRRALRMMQSFSRAPVSQRVRFNKSRTVCKGQANAQNDTVPCGARVSFRDLEDLQVGELSDRIVW